MSRSMRVIIAANAACGVGCDDSRATRHPDCAPVGLRVGLRVHERLLGEAAAERRQRVLRHAQLGVRHGVVQVDEERTRIVALDERRRFLREQIVDVVRSRSVATRSPLRHR